MEALQFDSLNLFYDPAFGLLYHRWRGQHNMHRFRPAVEYLQRLVQQCAVESWVADLNGLPNIGFDEQAWLSDEVLPSIGALPHLRQMALILNTDTYNQLAVESILHVAEQHLNFDVQFFADSVGAMDWVLNPTSQPAAQVSPRMVA
ncbi:hypothetical protein [Hymenobacter sp. CRA2]|uniref:hypothetical protein n=1 Tax=Hymenobacter sp. CRA2 TaxID=1955620 RepID=UPI00098F2A99|nr:hypothetical protein [Hymenobacter sp. CRA2]OON70699.1 hypothetical protein B0919_01400 [Hymenobacter sp. CRA2]